MVLIRKIDMNMIPTNYDPKASEEKWYRYWVEHRLSIQRLNDKKPPTASSFRHRT